MTVCDLMQALRLGLEPTAREHGLSFSIAADPQQPYSMILAGAGGLAILVYAGQARSDDTPARRIPVNSRFDLFLAAQTGLSADKTGAALFKASGSARKPLYAIAEEFERLLAGFEIPNNDGTVEQRTYYMSTDPAVMPDGFVLSCYKVSFQVRRALY